MKTVPSGEVVYTFEYNIKKFLQIGKGRVKKMDKYHFGGGVH